MLTRTRCVLAMLAVCLGLSANNSNAAIISNLGEAVPGFTQVHATHWVAQPFILDGSDYKLTTVTLGMTSATSGGGNFIVQIRNDASGSPGSIVLATLSGTSDPIGGGNQIYTGNVSLPASQTYYVVAGVTSGTGNYSWYGTFSDNQTGTLPWNIGDVQFASSGNPGNIWNVNTSIANLVALEATAVPEPSTLSLAAIGLAGVITARRLRRRRGVA